MIKGNACGMFWCLAVGLGMVLQFGEVASGQENEVVGTPPAVEPVPDPQPPKPLPGPKYKYLRFDDDFSYLDGPEGSYQEDFFDPIKNIRLGEDWRLSLGGEIRVRLEAETNKAFGAGRPTQDTFLLHRVFLHADLKYRNVARVFLQGVNAMIEDRDGMMLPIWENRFDFQQLFLDLRVLGEDVPLTFRVGRQELNYGKQRLVSAFDWANTRRRFDGVKLFWRGENLKVDAWWTHPVPVSLAERLNRKPDEYREEAQFYGLYSTYKIDSTHGVDGYFLALDDIGRRVNANGRAGDLTLFTLGSRFWGKTGPWDYETELAGQWGRWAGDSIQAWMFTIEGGYTFRECPWTPRIGVGYDYASGDDDPTDQNHQTFNQLFPLGHAYFGWADLVGRQNVHDARVHLTFKPHKKITAKVVMHALWLDEERDALYNAGGAATRRSPFALGGQEIGQELDLLVAWKIDTHQSMLFGYSHMWDGHFIKQTGASDDPDLFYVQYAFKF